MSYVWTKLIILHIPTSIYNIQCIFIITSDLCFLLFIRNGHLEIVQFLVNGNHCQANAVNSSGNTALHYAAE